MWNNVSVHICSRVWIELLEESKSRRESIQSRMGSPPQEGRRPPRRENPDICGSRSGAELGENQWVRLTVHWSVCPHHHLLGRHLNGQNGHDCQHQWAKCVSCLEIRHPRGAEEVEEVVRRLWSQPKLDFVTFWTFAGTILGEKKSFGAFFQFSLHKTEEGEAGAQGDLEGSADLAGAQGDLRRQKHENIGKLGRTRSNGGTGRTGNTGRTGSSLIRRCRSNTRGRARCRRCS